jgi:hypothetical protein
MFEPCLKPPEIQEPANYTNNACKRSFSGTGLCMSAPDCGIF